LIYRFSYRRSSAMLDL